MITIGTRVQVQEDNEDLPDDHDGRGTVEDMDVDWKGRQMYWVAFDGLGERAKAWFRASAMEVVQ